MTDQGLPAFTSRSTVNLAPNNIQVGVQYIGANDGMRQRIGKYHEYDLHEGELFLMISTERIDGNEHHARIGKVRSFMLNSSIDLGKLPYDLFDVKPEQMTTIEQDDNNLDQSTLSYSIKWKVNFDNL